MPIRWRLTLWFTLVLAGILALAGVVTHSLVGGYLGAEIDDSLREYSARVHGTLDPHQMAGPLDYSVIHSRLPLINEFTSPGIYIQLVDQYGNVVVKSDNLGAQELPVDPALMQRGFAGQAVLKTIAAGDGARVRVMATPLYLQDQTLLLEVGRSTQTMELAMARLRWALAAGVWASLVLSGLLGWVVVRRALSPVQRVTMTARSIEESSDLGRRVDYRGPADEIRDLATTFDSMIGRLDKAFQSQRQFIGDASHELRTPLTVIRGNLDLLRRGLSEEDRQEGLQAVRRETERMTRTVDDLLLLAEVGGGQVSRQEEVRLEEVLMDGLSRAQQLAGKQKVLLGRHDDLVAKGDAHRLKQAMGNLVDNAVKYTPDDGTITLSLARDGDWARITVADTGAGIASEHLPHVFERFYRADRAFSRAHSGTGLGLAIVKEIVESMGGKVGVDSQPGKGSVFSFWLRLLS